MEWSRTRVQGFVGRCPIVNRISLVRTRDGNAQKSEKPTLFCLDSLSGLSAGLKNLRMIVRHYLVPLVCITRKKWTEILDWKN